MIRVIDDKGAIHTIQEKLWNRVSKLPGCKYRLADVEPPKQVIEFEKMQSEIQKPVAEPIEVFLEKKTAEVIAEKEPKKEPEKETKKPFGRPPKKGTK